MAEQLQTVSVEVSEPIYRRLQRTAQLTYRSVDDILPSALNVALGVPPDLPTELKDELEAMGMFNDAALWVARESSLSPARQRRLHQLNHAAGARPLTAAERTEQTHLLDEYQRSMLRRAHALALLAYRGYEIPQRADLPDAFPHAPSGSA
ncbi:MAG: hypothetical protein DWI57_10045 [Chloroflexi bacterium]|nr:MAG: hypothetical protein DWI57_10045 [Chloroflexota bacterium]